MVTRRSLRPLRFRRLGLEASRPPELASSTSALSESFASRRAVAVWDSVVGSVISLDDIDLKFQLHTATLARPSSEDKEANLARGALLTAALQPDRIVTASDHFIKDPKSFGYTGYYERRGKQVAITERRPKHLLGKGAGSLALGVAAGALALGLTPAAMAAKTAAPTATINVWLVDNGKNVNALWAQLAAKFDATHPGDHVNIEIQPSSNSYKGKILAALGTNSPPALFFSWGGGPLEGYIKAGKVQPFADPGVNDAGNPSWKKDFLPSSLDAVTFNGKLYGIPITGTQPVFFFYNRTVLDRYHLSFPKTWPQLMNDVKLLNSHNVTPIALGNLDEWEGLMYLEYLTDRIGGPGVFLAIQNNQKGAWSNPAIIQALTDIQDLVKANAFEKGFDSITYTNGFTDALVYRGVAAMQLMGDWDLGGLLADAPNFVNSGELGIAPFPIVPGGKGNPADLEGNTTSYAAMASHITPAQTYVAEAFVKWAFTTHTYAADEVKDGLVPVITGSAGLLRSTPLARYLVPVYEAVQNAPSFQYSWDQALGPTKATPMLDNLAKVFELTETPQQFARIMNSYQTGS